MSDGAATTELLTAAKDAAARSTDYYALLDISPEDASSLTRDSVQRAWRKRSLKYHPDKAGAQFDASKWEEFGLARDILASDEARAAYDAARAALVQKQRERDLMNAKQRRFAEELERAEGSVAAAGSAQQRADREQEASRRGAEEAQERERQAAEGRRYMEDRKRKLREAEERERARERREDEERDDRIRELEGQIAEKARRRAEKRAKREARKGGGVAVAVVADDNEEEEEEKKEDKLTTPVLAPEAKHSITEQQKQTTTTTTTTTTMTSPSSAVPTREVKMSDDPIQFWETQWPKTKARLLAAQATKEKRWKETRATAC